MSGLLDALNNTPLGTFAALWLGLIWGSFFNVCIYRLPIGESLVRHRSRCGRCASPIVWYHNIPVLSFVWLRGRCARCSEAISWQYPVVELVTAGMFLWLVHRYGWTLRALVYAVFLSYLLILSVIDLRHRIIPDELSLSGIPLGIAAALVTGDLPWIDSVLGVALGGGFFWAVAAAYERFTGREGLGGGDVKLLAMLGAWLGYRSVLLVIILSSGLGSLVGAGLILAFGKGMKTAIPFGPFLAVAAVACLIWGESLQRLWFPG